MLDFPASPTNGQIFAGANGVLYQWNAAGGLWLTYGTGTNNAIINATPPANPVAGQMWWSPDLGRLFIYYNDGNSSQWVPATVGPNAPTPALGDFFATSTSVSAFVGGNTAPLVFPTVVSGNSGGWYNTGNGRFTPPAGRYRLTAEVSGYSSSAAVGIAVYLRKNGTNITSGSAQTPGANYQGQALAEGTVDANGTDYFDVAAWSSVALSGPAPQHWFGAFPVAASAVSVASQGFRQLGRVVPVAGQATIDFQNIPADINDLELRFDVLPQAAAALLLRFFDGSGSIVTAGYSYSQLYSYHAAAAGTATGMYTSGGASTSIVLTLNASGWGAYVSTSHSIQGSIKLNNIRESRVRACEFKTHYLESTATYYGDVVGGGNLTAVGAVTGLRLYLNNGNFAAGGAASLWGG